MKEMALRLKEDRLKAREALADGGSGLVRSSTDLGVESLGSVATRKKRGRKPPAPVDALSISSSSSDSDDSSDDDGGPGGGGGGGGGGGISLLDSDSDDGQRKRHKVELVDSSGSDSESSIEVELETSAAPDLEKANLIAKLMAPAEVTVKEDAVADVDLHVMTFGVSAEPEVPKEVLSDVKTIITVTFSKPDGTTAEYKCRVSMGTPMMKVKDKFCAKHGFASRSQVHLKFRGAEVQDDATPKSLGMVSVDEKPKGNVMEAVIERNARKSTPCTLRARYKLDGKSKQFDMNSTMDSPMKEFMAKLAEEVDKPRSAIKARFDGELIEDHMTPQDLDMDEELNLIDVHLG